MVRFDRVHFQRIVAKFCDLNQLKLTTLHPAIFTAGHIVHHSNFPELLRGWLIGSIRLSCINISLLVQPLIVKRLVGEFSTGNDVGNALNGLTACVEKCLVGPVCCCAELNLVLFSDCGPASDLEDIVSGAFDGEAFRFVPRY